MARAPQHPPPSHLVRLTCPRPPTRLARPLRRQPPRNHTPCPRTRGRAQARVTGAGHGPRRGSGPSQVHPLTPWTKVRTLLDHKVDPERNPVVMKLQHSIMVGILDRYADRFTEFQPPVPLEERMQRAARIPGASGVELVYPADLTDRERARELVSASGLAVSAVNLNIKSEPIWRSGSFTNPGSG